MKKILLASLAVMGVITSVQAQLSYGSLFPDFTRVDINGRTHHLYNELDSGKTAIINIGATWSDLAWSYHNTRAMDTMWAKHGPAGEPGVDAATTNDMVIYWIQGEPQSGIAQLTLNAIGSGAQTTTVNHTTYTKGNWVNGHQYYFICDSTLQGPYNIAWDIAYFPTTYMVCRDRLVRLPDNPSEAEAYAAHRESCPMAPPSATRNAKAMDYYGTNYFVCNAAMPLQFQNYGTDTITSATVRVKDGAGATVATVPWSGTLPSYSVATVSVPSFAATTFGGYQYTVSVTGDANAADDASADSLFRIYAAANADPIPVFEDFQGALSYKRSMISGDGNIDVTIADAAMIGADGTNAGARSLVFKNYYSVVGQKQSFILGNFNTTGATNLLLEFDVAYAQLATSVNDTLAVKVSTGCGGPATTVWVQGGATLATAPPVVSGAFYPTAATQWKHVIVNLPVFVDANTMIELENTSDYGNNLWVDNVWLASPGVAVKEVGGKDELSIAPNPARDNTVVTLSLTEAATVYLQVYDVLGRIVSAAERKMDAGLQKIEVNTAALIPGMYSIHIHKGAAVIVKQLVISGN